MSSTMDCESRVHAEVSWALTGTTISRQFLDPLTTVGKLKEMLEGPAKTPSEFLELLCAGSKLKDPAPLEPHLAKHAGPNPSIARNNRYSKP